MEEFTYEAPESIGEALAALEDGQVRALAGGTDLIPQLREGRRRARRIVDLKRIPDLVDITPVTNGGLAIGAAVTATRVAQDRCVTGAYPGLAAAAQLIGGRQIQNRASLGGNICNAAPSADGVPALMCLGALAHIAGPDGQRHCPVESLFLGPGRSSLGPGEILITIELPPPPERSAVAYQRFTPRREMDIAVAGAGAWLQLDMAGRVTDARVTLASVAPTPMRSAAAEAVLIGESPDQAVLEAAGNAAAQDARPISDIRGSADYRRELVRVLTARVIAACCRAIGGETVEL